MARLGLARHGGFRQGLAGEVRLGVVHWVSARSGKVWQAWRGAVRRGAVRQGRQGLAGGSWHGAAGHGRCVEVWQAWRG